VRLFILFLSMSCVIAYGYALAGYLSGQFGQYKENYIIWGLLVGTACGVLAMYLWKKHMDEWFEPTDEENKK
jgi:hypothetical protein